MQWLKISFLTFSIVMSGCSFGLQEEELGLSEDSLEQNASPTEPARAPEAEPRTFTSPPEQQSEDGNGESADSGDGNGDNDDDDSTPPPPPADPTLSMSTDTVEEETQGVEITLTLTDEDSTADSLSLELDTDGHPEMSSNDISLQKLSDGQWKLTLNVGPLATTDETQTPFYFILKDERNTPLSVTKNITVKPYCTSDRKSATPFANSNAADPDYVDASAGTTTDHPITICSALQLATIRNNYVSSNHHFALRADIDFYDLLNLLGGDLYWWPIAAGVSLGFEGSIDGNDHEIRNFMGTTNGYRMLIDSYPGINTYNNFIDRLGDGSIIENIKFINVTQDSSQGDSLKLSLIRSSNAGPVTKPIIRNIYLQSKISGSSQFQIGALGSDIRNVEIHSVFAEVDIEVSNYSGYIGGLIGSCMECRIWNSGITGELSVLSYNGGSNYAGGLVGYSEGSDIRVSYSQVNVSAPDASFVGGLAGYVEFSNLIWDATDKIFSTYASGSVHGNVHVGGLIGRMVMGDNDNVTISDSFASGSVRAENQSSISPSHPLIGSYHASTLTVSNFSSYYSSEQCPYIPAPSGDTSAPGGCMDYASYRTENIVDSSFDVAGSYEPEDFYTETFWVDRESETGNVTNFKTSGTAWNMHGDRPPTLGTNPFDDHL